MGEYDFVLRFSLYVFCGGGLVLWFLSLLAIFFLAWLPWSHEESNK